MHLSKLFVKTLKENPKWEDSVNAKFLLRWWFVHKTMAWVYTFLPLWLRVLNKIESIVRKHMNTIATEIYMPCLSPKENWEKTWRLETVDVLMKTSGANESSKNKCTNEYILNPTHEDIVTPLVKEYVKSYKDLPVSVYQIQSKFRNEARAKNWLLRGREFRMKDLYSFHATEENFSEFYEKSKTVYKDIFNELWLGSYTYITQASGWDFTEKFSHEFQVVCDAGEDTIYIDEERNIAYNEEINRPDWNNYQKKRWCEVGNIFPLETRFPDSFDFTYKDQNNEARKIIMWSYGIWPSRVMWVLVEKFHDEKGILWPEQVAPFEYVIIAIWENWLEKANKLYKGLIKKWFDVCLDDRDISPKSKFDDADLIWYPYQIIVRDKASENWNQCEFKFRNNTEIKNVSLKVKEFIKETDMLKKENKNWNNSLWLL